MPHWEVEYTEEFGEWWDTLTEEEQVAITASVQLLETCGPQLNYPHSSSINGSQFTHMRELRTQHQGNPYRTLYAFDPRRVAILLIAGNKAGNDRWYNQMIPVADQLYADHLAQLNNEGK